MKKSIFVFILVFLILSGCATNITIQSPVDSDSNSAQETVEKTEEVKPEPDLENDLVFDGCGEAEVYQNADWFNDFVDALYDFDLLNEKVFKTKEGVIKNISEICYSDGKSLALVIVGAGYCQQGYLARYDIQNKLLQEADSDSDPKICNAQFSEFGKRIGDIIPVTAVHGDAGCVGYTYYDYNYIQNVAVEVKSCFGCYDQVDQDAPLELECEDSVN